MHWGDHFVTYIYVICYYTNIIYVAYVYVTYIYMSKLCCTPETNIVNAN